MDKLENMENQQLLSIEDTQFIAHNMLMNYCLFDDLELFIKSYYHNLHLELNFDIEHFHFCITGLDKYYSNYISSEAMANGIAQTKEKYQVFSKLMEENHYRGIYFLIKANNSKKLAILYSELENPLCSPEDLSELFAQTLDNLHAIERVPVGLVMNCCGYEDIHHAYLEAEKLYSLFFFQFPKRVITPQKLAQQSFDCGVLCLEENFRKLRNMLCYYGKEEVIKQLDYILFQLIRNAWDYSYVESAYRFIEILFKMFERVYHISFNKKMLIDCMTLEDYREYVLKNLGILFDECPKRYTPNIFLTINYTYENYTKDITLQSIGEHLNVNATILSRQFNEETGAAIREFINQLRINQAKIYLHDKALNYSDIAHLVGFSSEKYLYEVFKRSEGVSLTKYRSELR